MLARLFVLIGGLIVLALTAALVGPYFIDWTGYRADFEREASAVLGRKVTVQGDATARLLPFPSVTFENVAVGDADGGEPALTVETFSMDAELAPFLRGDFLIFDMRIVRPKGVVSVAEDGTIDWAVRPSAPMDAGRISLEKLTVSDGQIVIRQAGIGRVNAITDLNAEISAKALTGPWRMNGTARLNGVATALSVSTGSVDENGAMRLRVRADPAGYLASVETDGNVTFDKSAARYAGDFKILPKAEPVPEGAAKVVTPPAYRLNGRFSLDHTRLAIDDFLFETGPLDNPYSADGTGFLDLGASPRFQLTAEGQQVRFDEAVGASARSVLTFEQRLAALEAALVNLPKPTIPGTIDLNLPAIVAGDTTIRDVKLSAEPAPDGWSVKSFAATLPGRATLEASGDLVTAETIGFKGSLLLAVGQPSGFAAWVSKDVDEAIRKLPAAGFSAKVDLTPTRQQFSDLELGLGAASFRGEALSTTPDDANPTTMLKLTGGALDLDGVAALASLFVNDTGASRFADRDFDLEVKAGPVTAGGISAETVDTAMRLRDGTLDVDRLSIGGLENATISATGRVSNLATDSSGNIDASIVSVDLAPLVSALSRRHADNPFVKALNARAAAYPGLLADAQLDLVAAAEPNGDGTFGATLGLKGTAGGTALSADLSATGEAAALKDARLMLALNGRNDDATALLALYGLHVLPLGQLGSGETDLSFKGTLGGLETSATFKGADFAASFLGTTGLGDDGPSAKGKLSVDAADIEPWMITSGAALPGMGLGTPVELDAEADFVDGLLVLSNIDGTVNEDAVTGDVNAEMKDGKPHLTGQLALDALNLEPLATMVLGPKALESVASGWSDVPFQGRTLVPFSADLGIVASTVEAGPDITAYDANLALAVTDDGLRLSDITATLFGGKASGLLELKNPDGTALVSGQMKLAGADLVTLFGDTGLTGSGDFSTTLSASGKSVGGLVAALSGSGTAALKSLTVAGIDPDAFAGLIAKADAIGRDIDAVKTAEFAPQVASAGSFVSAPVDLAFTVASGVLRAPPVTLANPSSAIDTDFQFDANTRSVSANGAITYRPGIEALTGSDPVLRFSVSGELGSTTRTFDTEPLAQFLTQRALEIEQARVEAMQSALLEKQRLRREVRYYAALQDERERAAEELRQRQEEERLRAEEQARLAAEEKDRAAAEAARQEAERIALEDAARRAALERERVKIINRAPVPPTRGRAPVSPGPQILSPDSFDDLSKPFGTQ